jgi:hypothetical protein
MTGASRGKAPRRAFIRKGSLVVRAEGDGTLMTVEAVGTIYALCSWSTPEGKTRRRKVPRCDLLVVTA